MSERTVWRWSVVVLVVIALTGPAQAAPPVLPDRVERVMALGALWATVAFFHPALGTRDVDWDGAFVAALPAVEAARTVEQYRRAVEDMLARLGDPATSAQRAATPWIAGDPWVERPSDGVLALDLQNLLIARIGGIQPPAIDGARVLVLDLRRCSGGQIDYGLEMLAPYLPAILTVDGAPVAARRDALRPATSGSTAEARDQRVAEMLLWGPDGSQVAVTVRGGDGVRRTVALVRSEAVARKHWAPKPEPHHGILAGGVGYIDLTALTMPEVDDAFRDVARTRVLILDMRGYPNGTGWAVAQHINVRRARYGAQFLRPTVEAGRDQELRAAHRFFQPLPPGDGPVYRGRVVVLIDDRAISQSEHSCLFFAEAAPVTFIGSPTHGTNGDVTTMVLPGDVHVSMTGQEVRHVDGRQLARVGIQPDVTVRPTLAGVRAGRDEVLERALRWVRTQR